MAVARAAGGRGGGGPAMNARAPGPEPRFSGRPSNRHTPQCVRSGGVLTPKPSAIRRACGRAIGARRGRVTPLVTMTFAAGCAPGAVAMKTAFDRLREVRNRSISQMILDWCWVLEKARRKPGLGDRKRPVDAQPAAAAERARKLSNQHDIRTSRCARARAARRRRTRTSARVAWYVDCSSRLRGSVEGEGIQCASRGLDLGDEGSSET